MHHPFVYDHFCNLIQNHASYLGGKGNFPTRRVHPHSFKRKQWAQLSARNVILGMNGLTEVFKTVSQTSYRGDRFFQRNFIGSLPNLFQNRWHAFLLSGFAHADLNHLIANNLGLYCVLSDRKFNHNFAQTIGIYSIASFLGSLGQTIYSRSRVVGGSAALMAFIVMDALSAPYKNYVLLFPIPGLVVSSKDMANYVFAGNLYFFIYCHVFRQRQSRIAWFGHLIGCSVGYLAHKLKQS